MKKLNQILFAAILMLVSISLSTAFTTVDSEEQTKMEIEFADNTCTVTVKKSTGYAARSVRVSTEVSGGISCIGGRTFYTDSDGEVTLKWVSGCSLKKIYVDGKGYEVNYKDGKNYNLTMK